MASRSSMLFCLVYIVGLCLVQLEEAASSDCKRTGYGRFGAEAAVCGAEAAVSLERQNRKMLAADFKEKEAVEVSKSKPHEKAAASAGNVSVDGTPGLVGWELRKVPSGPDPLHHNGNAPKKPRADP